MIMKRITTSLLICLIVITSYAQEHLEFKGIPLDGTSKQYVEKLKQAGFKFIESNDDGDWLTGVFTGKECTLSVVSTPVSHTVHTVYVLLKEQEDWPTIKSNYSLLKKGLCAKYGDPIECREEFSSPYKEGDGNAYLAFSNGKAKWYSDFRTPLGTISLYIRDQGFLEMSVIVRYTDDENSKKEHQE